MKPTGLCLSVLLLSLSVFAFSAGAAGTRSAAVPVDYQEVLKVLGRTGDFQNGVLKVGVPRNDLHVRVQGRAVPTGLGFGGWIGMTAGDDNQAVLMGDLVLTQDEVNPVLSALLNHGLEVTALHNHFFWEEPRIFYMHIYGHGPAAEMAREVKPALDLIGQARPKAAGKTSDPTTTGTLDTAKIAEVVGHTGTLSGAVYKITVGRDDLTVKDHGALINARMGLNSWAAFAGNDNDAVVAGDIAMLEPEVTPVLKALREHGLEVVAIHQHMIQVRPVIIFLHYYGRGPATQLAAGFRAALDVLGKA